MLTYRMWVPYCKEMLLPTSINFGSDGSALTVTVTTKYEAFPKLFVDSESCNLMLFTGLYDDKGIKIYEGDIVKYSVSSLIGQLTTEYGLIEYRTEKAAFIIKHIKETLSISPNNERINSIFVVGNKYQTPSLMPLIEKI